MKTGIELIAKERQEQIEKHGRTIQDDSINNDESQLVKASIAILDHDHKEWPTDWEYPVYIHINDKPIIERLAIAGALIAAEIDRLQYEPNLRKQGVTAARELSFGEKLVGLTFNPSNDDKVVMAKILCADLADLLNDENNSRETSQFSQRLFSHAVCEILNAQMNVVKVLTLKY